MGGAGGAAGWAEAATTPAARAAPAARVRDFRTRRMAISIERGGNELRPRLEAVVA
jgi:hypothetical protein